MRGRNSLLTRYKNLVQLVFYCRGRECFTEAGVPYEHVAVAEGLPDVEEVFDLAAYVGGGVYVYSTERVEVVLVDP